MSIVRRVLPALGLFFLAPLVAEFLLGNISITMLGTLVILAPMYGGGALLIREVVRRTGRGWASILLLALAYGIIEEAFMTESLFNPDYLGINMHLLQPAWIPTLGIGLWWTIYVLALHTIWSISVPIALMESLVPDRKNVPWLKTLGTTLVGILFICAACVATIFSIKQDAHHFIAAPMQFFVSAVIIAVLIAIAFLLPKPSATTTYRTASSPWIVGAAALLAASIFMLIPGRWGWYSVMLYLSLGLAAIGSIAVCSARTGWASRHRLALAAGAALAYGLHAFFQTPAVGAASTVNRIGNVIFLLGAITIIAIAARKTAVHDKTAEE